MRTIYISKKSLLNGLGLTPSYRTYCNVLWFLRYYPEVKYFYIDKKTGTLKPSKRKK